MKSHCKCPSPPGGSVSCDSRQVAYCLVVGGEVSSGCLTPTEDLYIRYSGESSDRRTLTLLHWALEEIGFDFDGGVIDVATGHNLVKGPPLMPYESLSKFWAEPLELAGWVRQGDQIHRARATVQLPNPYDDPRPLHRVDYTPA